VARKKTGENKVTVGNITRVSGKVTIAGGDIYEGYTVEQVSLLLTQITTSYQRKPFDGRCPYKGLEVFEEDDAELFFGRERLVDDLVSRVKESRTVFVTGPSGSGKSSLVRAGLIHALKKGASKGSDLWLYETMKPGRDPIKELSLAFSRLKGPDLTDYFLAHANEADVLNKCVESVLSGRKDQRFLLFVDQFEEVFTQINQEEERQAFINMLAHAGTVENGRVIVLFAMRSDFLSNCATYLALNELLSQQFRQIGAMQPEELVSAIALPAKKVGLPIEEELIARIINDMKGEPGALPLMQFALKELFEARQARGGDMALTLEDYLEREGIQKMLARHADDTFNQLSIDQQELARSIFSGLIEVGRGTADTKRTALFDELVPANASPADVLAIVQKLADARLIITDEQAGKDTVTISHEKLIEAWPWLKKLVNENRDAIALQNEIVSDAKEWYEHQRNTSYLYSGARVVTANEQLKSNKLVLSEIAYEYIRAGQTRQRRGQIALFGSIAIIFALLVTAVVIFANLTREAQKQTNIALARQLAAAAVSNLSIDPERSLLLAREALAQIDESGETLPEAVDALQQALHTSRVEQSINVYEDPGGGPQSQNSSADNWVNDVAFSPDGKRVAVARTDGKAQIWATDGTLVREFPGHTNWVHTVAFSPDGNLLATAGNDTTVRISDATTGELLRTLFGHRGVINSVAFSPDGSKLATASWDGTARIWDLASERSLHTLPPQPTGVKVLDVAFSKDGARLAVAMADGSASLWDVVSGEEAGEVIKAHAAAINSIAFDPAGTRLATASDDKTVKVWDLETRRDPLVITGHFESVRGVMFSADGLYLVTGSIDGTVKIWDSHTGKSLITFLGHSNSVDSIAFSPDNQHLASASRDGSVRIWNAAIGHTSSVNSVVFSPDGAYFATASDDRTARMWDAHSGKELYTFTEPQMQQTHGDRVTDLEFSPDGDRLATTANDGTIKIWDVKTRALLLRLTKTFSSQKDRVDFDTVLAFSPDGTKLASAGGEGVIQIWNAETGDPLYEWKAHNGAISGILFIQNGLSLITSSLDKTTRIWDMKTKREKSSFPNGLLRDVSASADGKWFVTGNDEGQVKLWIVSEALSRILMQHDNKVFGVALDSQGRSLASASWDKTAKLWRSGTTNLTDGALLWVFYVPTEVYRVAFSPDGKRLVIGTVDGQVDLYLLDINELKAYAATRVTRSFTEAECKRYFPLQTCPSTR
jgi:WD40 repeat protein/energy-coupling factor transporter ATP-binding protein EcfA2